MTVVAAVALAGGYTYRAKKSEITIIRANDPKHQKAPADDSARVMPGDVIEVPERFF
jgi:polysaccharide export outer membrane protein